MIVGVGVDVVPVDRFAAALRRRPALRDRLFTAVELRTPAGAARPVESLAARFAAKEAVAKALGSPGTMVWHDCEVISEPTGRPTVLIRGTVAKAAAGCGVRRWHLSLSHDGGVASALVVAES